MADQTNNAQETANIPQGTKMTLAGGIPSRNVGEEFVRVDEVSPIGAYGQIQRKTGFIPVGVGRSADLIQAVKEGKLQVKMGSQTRNGVFNVALIDPLVAGVEVPSGASASAEILLEHTA